MDDIPGKEISPHTPHLFDDVTKSAAGIRLFPPIALQQREIPLRRR
eukprot:CAMPEP_0171349354 /NCGR_PEP_ID=MMETSP0878-20121228/33484_1 /TAXON_ID=67004 /ORGANISM="Thalassiosira weissflogii, Strain CCMP1336" /LENGTH=45 /DNA_ID= /DNA_START= /DNA_END= /DNA_ORIENTATION=